MLKTVKQACNFNPIIRDYRMSQDRFDLFGSLPDTIKDEWIDDIETLVEKMDEYIDTQRTATGFDLRYNATLRPTKNDWRDCSKVLFQRDFETLMRQGWSG